jgi:hypothetical protein
MRIKSVCDNCKVKNKNAARNCSIKDTLVETRREEDRNVLNQIFGTKCIDKEMPIETLENCPYKLEHILKGN